MNLKSRGQLNIWLIVSIIVLGFLFVYQYIFDVKIDLNGDNASYYVLGKALNQGEGFVNTNSIFKTPNNHFPPGYPAIISVVMLFSESFVAIKIVNGIFCIGVLIISFFLVRKFSESTVIAGITVAFLLVNSHLLRYSTIMMSEMPFLFFSLLSLTLFLKTYDDTGQAKKYVAYVGAFLALMIAFYLKTLGIALLVAFVLIMAGNFKQRWKYIFAYISAFILLFLPWLFRSFTLGGNSYLKQLLMVNPYRPEMGEVNIGDMTTRLFKNIERYITREVPDVIFPFKKVIYPEPVESWEWAPGLIIVAIIILGIWKLPKYRWLAIIYISSNFFVLLLWPDVWVGVRFVLPLAPLLVMAMLIGTEWLLKLISSFLDFKKPIPIWPVALILLFNISEIKYLRWKAQSSYEPKWNNYFDLAKNFRRQDVSDVVVSCRKPVLFYLFSHTFTTNYKYTPDDKELLKDLKNRKANYVILDQLGYSSTFRYLYPAIQNNPDNFELIAQLDDPETYLLKFVP